MNTTSYYGFYCDKYNTRLSAVGYKIVAVTETLARGYPQRVLKIRGFDGTADTKEYTVDATDDMVNRFVEDMRRKQNERDAILLPNTMATSSVTNSIESYFENVSDPERIFKAISGKLYPRKCVNTHIGNLVSDELTPKCIQRRGTATIVHWKDGTQTKIVRQAGTEDAGLFAAFCMALSKKIFGTTRNLERAIRDADEERHNAVIEEAKLTMMKRHAERMEQNRKRALKRQRRLERWKIKRQEEHRKMNLEQMNQEATKQTIQKAGFGNDHDCDDCPYFEPNTDNGHLYLDMRRVNMKRNVEVTCEHADICRRMGKVLTQKEDSK